MTFRTCVECVWRCFGTREKLKECDEKESQKTNCVRRRMFIRQSSGRHVWATLWCHGDMCFYLPLL